MFSYNTVSEAINGLKQRGYTIDFNLSTFGIDCRVTPLSLKPSEFEITEFYRFEGATDPADEAIVYAIESHQGAKGVLVNAFGVYADSISSDMIQKLRIER